MDPEPGNVILDVGCGPGYHLLEWRSAGRRCVGLDASPHMVELARKRVGPAIPVQRGFAESLPFSTDEFDTVVLIKTLEFARDPVRAVQEAERVSRKNVLILTVNAWSFAGLTHVLEGLWRRSVFGDARLFSLWAIRRLVGEHVRNVRFHWASASVKPLRSHGKAPGPVTMSPFGDLLAVRLDLAQKV